MHRLGHNRLARQVGGPGDAIRVQGVVATLVGVRRGQNEVGQGRGLVHVSAEAHLEGDVAHGLGHFSGLGQGVGRVGLVDQERARGGLAGGHIGQEARGVLGGIAVSRSGDGLGAVAQEGHAAALAHAAKQHVEGGRGHEVERARALTEGSASHDQRGLGGLDLGGEFLQHLGLEPGGGLEGGSGLGGQGLVVAEVGCGGNRAGLDEGIGQGQAEGAKRRGRHGQPLVANAGGVVQHRSGVHVLGGRLAAGGAGGGEGLLVGHGGAPGIKRVRADHEHQVGSGDVEAGLAGAAHKLHAFACGEHLAGHDVEAVASKSGQHGGEHFIGGAGLVAADGGDFASLPLEGGQLFNEKRLGVFPLNFFVLALAHPFHGGLDARRAVHQLGATRANGAHAAFAHGICGIAGDGKGQPAHGLDLDGATGGAKFAQRGLGFLLTLVQAGNPTPVLGPDGHIVQALPNDRREQGARNAPHDDFDESSAIQTHLTHPSFTCGRRGKRC